jgi:hypothetical protein
MRTQYFFNHPYLDDMQYPSFAVLKDSLVYIIGGLDYARSTEETPPELVSGHSMMIIDVPLYQK